VGWRSRLLKNPSVATNRDAKDASKRVLNMREYRNKESNNERVSSLELHRTCPSTNAHGSYFFLSALTSSGAAENMAIVFHVRLNPSLLEGTIDSNMYK